MRAISSEELRFIMLDMAPWASVSTQEPNKLIGILPELIEGITKRTGIVIKASIASYPRIYRELEVGRGDCTILNLKGKYSQLVVKGGVVLQLPFGVIANKQLGAINKYNLQGLRISFLRDGLFHKGFSDERILPKQKEYDTGYELGLKKIAHGRVNAIAGAIPTIQYFARESAVDHLLGSPLVLYFEPIYLQCSRHSSSLQYMEVINQAIQEMKEDTTLSKILKKYKY